MKFLVVGLGSMGKRRVRNLLEIGIDEIIGYDIREDRRKEASDLYSIKVTQDFESAINMKPDAMIISTPPDKHLEYAIEAANKDIHFFTEVNTMTPDEIQIIIDLLKKKKIIGVPSTNLMFHPSVVKIANIIKNNKIGKVLSFNFHSGSYLPDWHPWERLEDYYVCKKETGGGRDQIAWELSWIMALMGKPKIVTAMTRKLAKFQAEIYDIYDLLIQFENNSIGHVMVDVIQRPPGRMCEIIGEEGYISWDYEDKMVRLFLVDTNTCNEYPEKENYKGYKIEYPKPGFATKDIGMTESYIDEIKNFIDIINGKKNPEFTFEDEKLLLKTMYAAEESSEKGITVKL
ncbi:MAG: Gfo/Idh/MocA family oxidoreductase [Nitrosotalea sp.]